MRTCLKAVNEPKYKGGYRLTQSPEDGCKRKALKWKALHTKEIKKREITLSVEIRGNITGYTRK